MNATPQEMIRIRHKLGLSPDELADWLGLERGPHAGERGGTRQGRKRVHEMETGTRMISGPVTRCLEAFAAGWRPGDDDINQPLQTITNAVEGLIVEASSAKREAERLFAAGRLDDARAEAGKAEGLARAAYVLSHALVQVAGVKIERDANV